MTSQQIKTKITELEQWLTDNHPEHCARPQIEADLRNAKQELLEQEPPRTYEQDTFCFRDYKIYHNE